MITNVDCPWDLQSFGGRFSYVHLFAARPAGLRQAYCFRAAHASSGYALMALYFVAYERSRKLACSAWASASVYFGVAQQARGAHFASHDLWSAFLGMDHSAYAVCVRIPGASLRTSGLIRFALFAAALSLAAFTPREAPAADPTRTFVGRAVGDVLDDLRAQGLTFIYNTRILPAESARRT